MEDPTIHNYNHKRHRNLFQQPNRNRRHCSTSTYIYEHLRLRISACPWIRINSTMCDALLSANSFNDIDIRAEDQFYTHPGKTRFAVLSSKSVNSFSTAFNIPLAPFRSSQILTVLVPNLNYKRSDDPYGPRDSFADRKWIGYPAA
jgi:hypothetical protein